MQIKCESCVRVFFLNLTHFGGSAGDLTSVEDRERLVIEGCMSSYVFYCFVEVIVQAICQFIKQHVLILASSIAHLCQLGCNQSYTHPLSLSLSLLSLSLSSLSLSLSQSDEYLIQGVPRTS